MDELIWDNPLFAIPSICGGIFLVTGFVLNQFPPKKINYLYGYRTKNSMRNQQSWDFAQQFSSKLLIKYGIILAITSLLSFITDFKNEINLIIAFLLLFALVLLLFLKVEKALKTFSKV